MHISSIQSPRGNLLAIDGSSQNYIPHDNTCLYRPRSRSVTTTYEKGSDELKNRMMHTVDFMKKSFKPNTRGDFVHSTFATLKDVLCNIPKDIGFNMEISMS